MLIYKCNNDKCNITSNNANNMLTIGSKDDDLYINNKIN